MKITTFILLALGCLIMALATDAQVIFTNGQMIDISASPSSSSASSEVQADRPAFVPKNATNGWSAPVPTPASSTSVRKVQLIPGGARAEFGLQKVDFDSNIAARHPVNITTPDGQTLWCRPVALGYFDTATGKSAILGWIKNSQGGIQLPNKVIYRDAFTNIKADVQYEYTANSLEQNVILRQKPPAPEVFGLNPETTQLEIWTEWSSAGYLREEHSQITLRDPTNNLGRVIASDTTLDFGTMKIARGKAFNVSGDSNPMSVAKEWHATEAGGFLLEIVDYEAIEPKLATLPTMSAITPKSSSSQGFATRKQLIQALETVKAGTASKAEMLLAQNLPQDAQGVVLDFIIVSAVPLPVGAMSWWAAGGDVSDAVGTNNGTLINGATYGAGEVGQGFSVNGSTSYAKIPYSPSLNPSNRFTLEFWLKPDAANTMNTPQGVVTTDFYGVEISNGYGGTYGINFFLSPDGGSTWNMTSTGNGGGAPISAGVWHHVAGTYNGTNMQLYIDGGAWGNPYACSGAIFPMPTNGFLAIGSEAGRVSCGCSRYFNGIIDEVTLYNRALSASEITNIYTAGGAGKINPDCLAPLTNAVGWWPGDGNAYDVARTNFGTLQGAATYSSGRVGQTFDFDGSDSYVEVPNNDAWNFRTNNFSIEFWVNFHYLDYGSLYYPEAIFVAHDEGGGDQNKWIFALSDRLLTLLVDDPIIGVQFLGQVPFTPDLDTWYHVALVREGSTLKVYEDGILAGTNTITANILDANAPLTIGQAEGISFVNGMIDELAIYNRALSGTEIAAIYTAGGAGKCKVDSDSDGLTDMQEQFLGSDPNNPDTDGDGVTDGNEVFVNHTDPLDYFNGVQPVLTIVSGNNQNGTTNTFLPQLLTVSVTRTNGTPLTNAPLNFTVSVGGVLVATSTNGTTTNSITLRTGTNGQAAIYALMPSIWQSFNQITATAWSGTNSVQVTFTETTLQGIRLWLRADVGVTNSGGAISAWADQSGNTNNATQSSSGNRPLYVTNVLNGLPVIHFNGTNSYFNLSNFLNGATGAEAFVILKMATNRPTATRSLWQIGSYGGQGLGSIYPNTDGSIWDDFGSGQAHYQGVPSQNLTQYYVYEVTSQSSNFTAWVNGVLQYQTITNTVGFTSSPMLGYEYLYNYTPAVSGYFAGDIAEVMIFNRGLTTDERFGVNSYLNGKYALVSTVPAVPTNLVATAISTNQIGLTWSEVFNAGITQIGIERSTTSNGVFTVIAQISSATSYVDTNLTAGTAYYYRVRAINLTQWSAYSTVASATTLTNGVSLPFGSLALWLKADAGVLQASTNTVVNLWADQSGHGNHAVQTSGGNQPVWVPGALTNRPVMRFNGTNSYFNLPNFLNGATGAEAFVILKMATNRPAVARSLWQIGTYGGQGLGSIYPNTDGSIWDDFGSGQAHYQGVPSQNLTQYYVYEVTSQSSNFTAWVNGVLQYQTITNTVGFTSSPMLGYEYLYNYTPAVSGYFAGDIAEVMIFNRGLTTDERFGVNSYLNGKYALVSTVPAVPTNLVATAISTNQIGLTWSEVFNAGITQIGIERSTTSNGVFTVIAQISSATSYVDTNLTAGTAYYYRVRAINLTQWSAYSTVASATTLTNGVSLPFGSLALWLKADAGVLQASTNTVVNLWADQSGHGNHAVQTSGGNQPVWVPGALTNRPVMRFNGTNSYFNLPNFLNGATGAEAFVVLKAMTNPPTTYVHSLWQLGNFYSQGSGGAYPNSDGSISDDFGSWAVQNEGIPTQSLYQYHVYEIIAKTDCLATWINGVLQCQIPTNTVFFTTSPMLGHENLDNYFQHFNGYFAGDIAEVLVFNQPLSVSEKDTVNGYLNLKYGLYQYATNPVSPNPATNLLATGVTSYQLNLQWKSFTNTGTYHLERSLGTNGTYQEIVFPTYYATNLVDTTAIPTNQYYYRVRSHNLFGDAYSISISPPTVSITNWPVTTAQSSTNAITAQATDADGTVNNVQLAVNGVLTGIATSAPYTINWIPPFHVTYSLTALATDNQGNSQYSAPVSVSVYLDSNMDGIPDWQQVLQGDDPLNPWLPPAANTNDHTAPIITLLIPTNAIVVP